jgi:predicted O-methyltransferase YrrM
VTPERWSAVDRYFDDLFAPPDAALDATLQSSAAAGLPPHNVTAAQGKLLMLLALAARARNILEIGTLGGYSTIWLARALADEGRVITLENDANHAAVAQANIARAGLADRVEIRLGPALESLAQLVAQRRGPFDLIFIDADKPNNPHYLAWTLKLARRGTLIIADNVVRDGAVADPASSDASVLGIRAFNDQLAADSRLSATAIQTVGSKGWDGFAIAVVTSDTL